MIQSPPPKHLRRRSTRGGPSRLLPIGVVVGLIAVLGLGVIVYGVVAARGTPPPAASGQAEATDPSASTATSTTVEPAPVTTVAPARPVVASGLVPDPSFEEGLGSWRELGGAQLGHAADPHSGRWAATLTAGRAGGDESPGMAIDDVVRMKADVRYEAEVWVKGAPGQEIELRLVEYVRGRRFATDTVGVRLADTGWRRIDIAHDAHEAGGVLGFELVAPGLSGGRVLTVDDVTIRQGRMP